MDDILGIPVAGLMIALLILLSLCLLSVAWVAWRRPVIFKLGTRNIPRRKAQTSLIVVGLMLSTLIISAALGTGDTVNYSMTTEIYDNLGQVDELVVASHEREVTTVLTSDDVMHAGSLERVDRAAASIAEIDGVMPLLDARVPVINHGAQLAEPDVVLSGLDSSRLDAFGGLKATDGKTIDLAGLGADTVVVSERLSGEIDAVAGDTVTVYVDDVAHEVTVAAVAQDSWLSGVRRAGGGGLEFSGLAMPLDAMQTLIGQPGAITSIAISNDGTVRDSLDHSQTVSEALRAALSADGFGVSELKNDRVDAGEKTATQLTTIFIILGLFSVASGVLLIVLIFTMLASERRSEMGMERAVGAHRRQLVQQFVAEGSGYALLAGAVGAALGVAATFGIATGLKVFFGDYVPVEAHVEPRSMIVAYCLGVVITFATVVASSWKISRINIVAAIRDMPDYSSPRRKKSTFVWATLLTLAGGFLTLMGSAPDQHMLFSTGMSILPFGIALYLRFFGVPSRPVFTGVGLWILTFWLMPDSLFESIFGTYDIGIESFFTGGIFLVLGATTLIVQNNDILLKGVSLAGNLLRGKLPAIRTAVAYPGAAIGRTGLTIAMFSLIIFSLVMMATMNANSQESALGDKANAGWEVRADTRSSYAATIGNIEDSLRANGVDISGLNASGTLTNPSEFNSDLRVGDRPDDDDAGEWKQYTVFGMDAAFIENSELTFQGRATGYETDEAIIQALANDPNLAVLDTWGVESDDLAGDPDAFILTDLTDSDKTFEPRTVELIDPRSGQPHSVTVIGVIDASIGSLHGVYLNQATIDTIYGETSTTSYVMSLDDKDTAGDFAKDVEAALLTNGVEGVSIADELKEMQKEEAGFMYIIEGFMGLGLFVGVAAVGVIAFRSVVERRQQIGMLRAMGWRRELISFSFVAESAFIVGLGILTGTLLGLRLANKLVANGEFGEAYDSFVIPWPIILIILGSTFVAALLMTWIPSRQAARIAPAEALRYE
ncbi:MAG TPA: FtsX-like permease family protein [Thermomicrobiales bacterium]|nr:FtsX-like permease family protein [Thermomicrobiales bacterium]